MFVKCVFQLHAITDSLPGKGKVPLGRAGCRTGLLRDGWDDCVREGWTASRFVREGPRNYQQTLVRCLNSKRVVNSPFLCGRLTCGRKLPQCDFG